MHRTFLSLCPLLLAAVLAGCSSDDDSKSGDASSNEKSGDQSASPFLTEKDGGHSEGDGHDHGKDKTSDDGSPSARKAPRSRMPIRDTLAGRWILRTGRYSQMMNEKGEPTFGEQSVVLISVRVPQGDAPGDIDILTTREPGFSNSNLEVVKLTDQEIRFKGTYEGGALAYQFSGVLHQGAILGMLEFGDGRNMSARMLPTDERTFARVEPFHFFEEMEEFIKVMQSPVPIADAADFAEAYPISPLPRLVYMEMIQRGMQMRRPTGEIADLIDGVIASQKTWGRLQLRVYFEVIQLMMTTQYDIEFCSKKMDEFESALEGFKAGASEEDVKAITDAIESARKLLDYRRTLDLVESSDAEKKAEGLKQAREKHAENPFDPVLANVLADDHRENGRFEEAMRLYAEIATLPMQEKAMERLWQQSPVRVVLPSERLAKMWGSSSQKGSIDEFSAKAYADRIHHFVKEPVTERPDGESKRIVLCELFGSAEEPQSVAADVAISGLEKTFPHSMLVVLRYEQHAPSQNPLAGGDGEARGYNYYGLASPPTVFLNGRPVTNVEGLLIKTADVYRTLTKAVEDELKVKEDATLNLTATREGDVITVDASVEGEDLDLENLRLRLALTESKINYIGFNGVRDHDMVVRAMPGGDRGIAADESGLKYSGSIDVGAIRKRVQNYLDRFEKNQGQAFSAKPADVENLHLVAFVQDETTRRILQAAVVSVSP